MYSKKKLGWMRLNQPETLTHQLTKIQSLNYYVKVNGAIYNHLSMHQNMC